MIKHTGDVCAVAPVPVIHRTRVMKTFPPKEDASCFCLVVFPVSWVYDILIDGDCVCVRMYIPNSGEVNVSTL